MTLKQAYTMWACAPKNVVLAAKHRNAIQRVLMKKYNDVELKDFTTDFVGSIFSNCTTIDDETKSKAASILVHILRWGNEHGYCEKPMFTFSIANVGKNDEEKEHDIASIPKPLHELSQEPLVRVKKEALIERKKVLAARSGLKAPRHVVQIDKHTLKPVKVWQSINDVYKELGIRNIHRAIERKGLAGGYFWCAEGDEKNFKPNSASIIQEAAEKKKKEKVKTVNSKPVEQEKPVEMVVPKDITTFSDDELISEMKRRGWKGSIQIVLNVEL